MLVPDRTYTLGGVTVNEKLIPDSAVWTDAEKAQAAGAAVGDPYKQNQLLSGGSGLIQGVTIHNTDDLQGVADEAEQYTRATWPNQNMGNVRVHFYIDENGAWQNLPLNQVGWHAGDTEDPNGGNNTTVALEVIMNDDPMDARKNADAEDNAARIAAQILFDNGLSTDQLYTHTYWINREDGITFPDKEVQNVYVQEDVYKICPQYILPHWAAFRDKTEQYLQQLRQNVQNNFQIGDRARFLGGYQYPASDSEVSTGGLRTPGEVIITHVAPNALHPYHVVSAEGSSSNAYGWVNSYQLK